MDPTRMPLLVALVLMTSFLLPPQAQAQESVSLMGTVCPGEEAADLCRSQGMGDASLTIVESGLVDALNESQTTTSGMEGDYRFDGLAPGEYELTASRTGFEDRTWTLSIEEDRKHDVVLVGRSVTVSGTVHADGTPIEDALVTAYGEGPGTEAETDADGAWSFEVQAGYYELQVQADDHRTQYDYLLLDGTGAHEHDLDAVPAPDIPLTGTVTDGDGAPVADAAVVASQYGDCCYAVDAQSSSSGNDGGQDSGEGNQTASSPVSDGHHGGSDRFETTTDADGNYALEVRPGWVNLQIHNGEGYTRHDDGFEAQEGESYQKDATLKQIPDRTARIAGQVVDAGTGDGLRYVSISVQNPEYGRSECSRDADDGSDSSGSTSGSSGGGGGDQPDSQPAASPVMEPDRRHDSGCRITVQPDGSFEGTVTPGYTIITVHHQQWRACQETQDEGGAYTRDCGPQYHRFTRTLDLEADSDNRLPVPLGQRPGPDATISGYVVDQQAEAGIAGARIHFSNQDAHGSGWAETDGDGSYKVQVRSGTHMVSVWAEGYFRWAGVVQIGSGDDLSFDAFLKEGEEQYGHCCYGYAEPAYAEDAAGDDGAGRGTADAGRDDVIGSGDAAESAAGSSDGDGFQDLGGGLGPYDHDARQAPADNQTPGPAIPLLVVALALLALRRRC